MKRLFLSIGLLLVLLPVSLLLLHEATVRYELGTVGFTAGIEVYTWREGHEAIVAAPLSIKAIPIPPSSVLSREGVTGIEFRVRASNETASIEAYLVPLAVAEKLLGLRAWRRYSSNTTIAQYVMNVVSLDAMVAQSGPTLNTSEVLGALSAYKVASGHGQLAIRVHDTGDGALLILAIRGRGSVIVTPVLYRSLAPYADPLSCSAAILAGAVLLAIGALLWHREARRVRELFG